MKFVLGFDFGLTFFLEQSTLTQVQLYLLSGDRAMDRIEVRINPVLGSGSLWHTSGELIRRLFLDAEQMRPTPSWIGYSVAKSVLFRRKGKSRRHV